MEILGMSIVIATLVGAGVGIGVRNLLGYLNSGAEGYDKKKSIASAIIGFMTGVPVVGAAFLLAFENQTEPLSEIAQLLLFFVQVTTIAGVDALVKGGMKARAKAA